MQRGTRARWWVVILMAAAAGPGQAQRQMEFLDRGLVAVPLADGGVSVGWRLLVTDPESVAFNLYRQVAGQDCRHEQLGRQLWQSKGQGHVRKAEPRAGLYD